MKLALPHILADTSSLSMSSEDDSDAASVPSLSSFSSQSSTLHSQSDKIPGTRVNELSLDFLLNDQHDIKLEEDAAQDRVFNRAEQARKRQRRYEMVYRQRKGVRTFTSVYV